MKASLVEYYEEEEEKPAFCLDVVELKDPIELPPLPPPKDVEEVLLDGEVRCRESVDAPRGTLAYASLDHALSEKVKWEIATRDLRRSQLPEHSAERTADLERRGKTFALRWKLHGYVFIAREPFFKKFSQARKEGRLVSAEKQVSPRSGDNRKEGRLVSAEKQVSPRSGETYGALLARRCKKDG